MLTFTQAGVMMIFGAAMCAGIWRGYHLSVWIFRKRVLAMQEKELGVQALARNWAEAGVRDLEKFELTPSQKVEVVVSTQQERGASWELREATRREMNSLMFGGK